MNSLLISSSATLIVASVASAQSFTWLDQSFSANDLTPDGRIVVGDASGGAYLWSLEDGYTFIPGGTGNAVSDDGTVVFGNINDPDNGTQTAAIWTAADGWQSLGGLGSSCGSTSSAYELSADGTVGVGLGWNSCSGQGFRWTASGGMQPLEMLMNGNNRASVLSADGELIGGFAQGSFSRTPAIWHADGTGELLDPAGDVLGEVHAISDDGTILLGSWDGDAFTYTEADGLVTFDGPIPSWTAIPMDISDNGTIVGFDNVSTSRTAWIRLPGHDTRRLKNYLGLDLGVPGVPATLEVAQAISRDGRVIIGHNAFANGWIVHLQPNPDLDGDGVVGFGDLLAVLAAWGPCGEPCLADLDEDGQVGFGDILILLSSWG